MKRASAATTYADESARVDLHVLLRSGDGRRTQLDTKQHDMTVTLPNQLVKLLRSQHSRHASRYGLLIPSLLLGM